MEYFDRHACFSYGAQLLPNLLLPHCRSKPGFTKRERSEAHIAIYCNMAEALVTLLGVVTQLGDDQRLTMTQVAVDDAIIREQGSIVQQYWETVRPFYIGITQ